MSSRKNARPKHKNHAQDCRTLRKGLSVRRSCHGFCSLDGVHPLGRHGHLARHAQRPDCCWTLTLERDRLQRSIVRPITCGAGVFRSCSRTWSVRKAAYAGLRMTMLKRAQQARVYLQTSSTTNVVLFEQRLVSRLVRPLQVVQKRTARRYELQEAAARMIVLHVRLEVPGQVVDAFRQDRDLNLRRAGIAGLDGISLDDFRFAFGGNRHRQTLSLRPPLAVSPVRLNTRLGMSSPLPISASAKRRPATVT